VKREVADDLARRGMIRVEEAIEEDDVGHRSSSTPYSSFESVSPFRNREFL
jgi:hypothetical protein